MEGGKKKRGGKRMWREGGRRERAVSMSASQCLGELGLKKTCRPGLAKLLALCHLVCNS